jgi:single-stranded DNA-binding protein
MNITVVCGTLSSDPVWRSLPSGSTVVALEVTTDSAFETRSTVPVSMVDPRGVRELERLGTGDVVVVIGETRRRFFRTGGATGSRTEVRATHVIPAGRRARVTSALRHVADVVGGAADRELLCET